MNRQDFWAAFIARLKAEGLAIHDDRTSEHSLGKARHYLPQIGAYRFRGYFEPFRGHLSAGASVGLNDVLKLYKFDRRLRLLSLDAIERIEVSVKARLSDYFLEHHGKGWLSEAKAASSFDKPWMFDQAKEFLTKAARKRHELETGQDGNIPLKALDPTLIIEAASFGEVSRIVSYLRGDIQKLIASSYRLQPLVLSEWLRGLTRVRNIAAHHSRLWNARFSLKPPFPITITREFVGPVTAQREPTTHERYYAYAIVMYYFLNKIARNTKWHRRLRHLVEDQDLVPAEINLKAEMGFPNDWSSQRFWNLPPP